MSNPFKSMFEKNKRSGIRRDIVSADDPEKKSEKIKKSFKNRLSGLKVRRSANRRKPKKINSRLLFGILAVICAALIVLTAVNEKFAQPFKYAASLIVVPAQTGINAIGSWISDEISEMKSMEELKEENEELRAQVDELTAENTLLQSQDDELSRLKELLELQDVYSQYDTTAAQVVAVESSDWFSVFTINKGSADGIEKNMNVITKDGLVGIVTDVGINFATVRSIIDDDSNISAMLQKNSELCIVSGNLTLKDDNLMEMSDADASVSISEGDAIVTSNISSVYLPGILIGYVSSTSTDGNELTQSGYVTPAVNFSNISEVLVILDLKETDD